MADGVTFQSATPATPSAGVEVATDDAGADGHVQIIKLAISTDGSATVIPADAANGLDVDVTRLPALPAGTNNIGDVDVLSLPALPAGTNNIGDVDVLSLPALPAGTNNIGDVDIVTMPATVVEDAASAGGETAMLIAGVRNDAAVAKTGADGDFGNIAVDSAGRVGISDLGGSISVDDNSGSLTVDGTVAVSSLPALASGTNNIGDVDVLSLPTLPAGDNNIGNVDIVTMPTVTETNSASALTALQLIDNIVQTEDAAAAGGESGVQVLGVRKDAGGTLASADGDFTPFQMDSSGNLRVNVAAGGAGDGAILDGVSGSIKATVFDYTNSNPLSVRLTDTNGDYVGAGGGTQYTEDAAAATDPVGTALNLIRKDTPASEVSADGDNIAARGNSAGAQYVELLSGTAKIGGDATNGLKVDVTRIAAGDNNIGNVDLASAIPAGTNNIGDVDVLSLPALPAGTNNIGDVDIVSLPNVTLAAGTNTNEVVGDVAQDAPVAGNPVLIGGRASAAAPTDMSADGDAVYLWTTLKGALNIADAGGSLTVDNGGTFAVQESGAALTALQLIDDTVATDGSATPTKGILIAGQDGTNAQTIKTDTNGELQVDVLTMPTVTETNSGAALTALQKIDDPVLVDDAAFTPATSSVAMAGFEADETSTDSVDEGDAGAARMTLDRKLITTPQPHTKGGLAIFRSLDLDETEEDVKTTAGQVYGWFVTNRATSPRYIKFYNATAATVVVGTTTPVITMEIPGNSTDHISANALGGIGIEFDTAICVAATTGFADADTGAPAANDVIVNIFYK